MNELRIPNAVRQNLERVDLTLEPYLMRNLDWLVSEWQEIDRSRMHNRSEAVDHLIDLTREQVEALNNAY